MATREEVSVEMVVVMLRLLEMERNFEPTLPSPLTSILQMRKQALRSSWLLLQPWK